MHGALARRNVPGMNPRKVIFSRSTVFLCGLTPTLAHEPSLGVTRAFLAGVALVAVLLAARSVVARPS